MGAGASGVLDGFGSAGTHCRTMKLKTLRSGATIVMGLVGIGVSGIVTGAW